MKLIKTIHQELYARSPKPPTMIERDMVTLVEFLDIEKEIYTNQTE